MLIISQNKSVITENLELHMEVLDRKAIGEVPCFIKNGAGDILGRYSSREKAIKVLDMICGDYLKTTAMCITTEGELKCLPQAVVFQMPRDEEVHLTDCDND